MVESREHHGREAIFISGFTMRIRRVLGIFTGIGIGVLICILLLILNGMRKAAWREELSDLLMYSAASLDQKYDGHAAEMIAPGALSEDDLSTAKATLDFYGIKIHTNRNGNIEFKDREIALSTEMSADFGGMVLIVRDFGPDGEPGTPDDWWLPRFVKGSRRALGMTSESSGDSTNGGAIRGQTPGARPKELSKQH